MKTWKRILIITMLSLITFVSTWAAFIFSVFVGSMPKMSETKRVFTENEQDFAYISAYLTDLPDSYVYIDVQDYDCEDEAFQDRIAALQNHHVTLVIKEKYDVLFCFGTSLDSSSGLMYCKNGKPHVFDRGTTEMQEIKVPNWFYFHHVDDE